MRPDEYNPSVFHEEVEMTPTNEDYMLQLFEAAVKGSVATFTILMRNDPLILHKISLTSFNETPLHISALAGHLDFTEALLREKSELATRLDYNNRSPLHLASAEGHTEIVKALLRANVDVCLVRDKEGRIPLHLAVMRGHVEVIQELITVNPNTILERLNGITVLHLAVRYNQLKALKQLVMQLNEDDLFNFTDHLGNTILHSAVMLKQSETIRYLFSVPKLKAKVNTLNRMGFSALDLLEHHPRDFKSLEIGDILMKAGSTKSTEDPNLNMVPTESKLVTVSLGGQSETQSRSLSFRLKGKIKSTYHKCKNYFTHQANWVEEMQGTLMLVATLTATISFQVATSPPGGVWDQDYTYSSASNYTICKAYDLCQAGTAVLAYVYPESYLYLIIFAIISFIASLGVVLLAISGLPLKNKLCTWLMTIAMVCAITFVLITFVQAISIVTPDHIFSTTAKALDITLYFWISLVGIVAMFATVHLLFWLVSLLGKLIRLVRKILSRHIKNNQDTIC